MPRQNLTSAIDSWVTVEAGSYRYTIGDGTHVSFPPVIADEDISEVPDKDHMNTKLWTLTMDSLRHDGHLHLCAWLRSSSYVGTGRWMEWCGGLDSRFILAEAEFREALRLRLLIPPFPSPGNVMCPTCQDVSLRDAPMHPLDCNALRAWRTRCHNLVRDQLAKLLRKEFSDNDVQGDIRVEHSVVGATGITCKADIYCPLPTRTYIIDIAIVDPSAPSYTRMDDSHEVADAAAKHRERDKTTFFNEAAIDGAQFIPFMVEATGRLGPAARDFLHLIISRERDALKDFLGHMSVTLAKLNARCIQIARSKQSYGSPGNLRTEMDDR